MKDISDIKLFLEHLKKMVKKNLVAIIIYGSLVRNEQDEFSDIDICVILKKKDELTIQKIKKITSKLHDQNYFIFPIEKNEIEKNIVAGDVFYKHEVVGKGMIFYESGGYVTKFLKKMESDTVDFKAAEELHRRRYSSDRAGIDYELRNIIDRLRWAFTDLICVRLAKIKVEPHGTEEYTILMSTDKILSDYVNDFNEILKFNKDYQHHRIPFPFSKLKHFLDKLMELETNVLNI